MRLIVHVNRLFQSWVTMAQPSWRTIEEPINQEFDIVADDSKPLPKNQHYVPQFLLRGFCCEESESLYVFDKSSGRVFPSAPRNVAAENGFYNFEGGSAEPGLATLESDCAKIIHQIRESRTVGGLSSKDRFSLDFFVAVQILRVKSMREMLGALNQRLNEMFAASGGTPENIQDLGTLDKIGIKHMSIENLKLAKQIVPNLENKRLVLMQSPESASLYISDNPVVLHCTFPRQLGIGLGIGTPGVEIYLPISKTLTLQFLCSEVAAQIELGAQRAKSLKQAGLAIPTENLIALAETIGKGTPMQITTENVDHLNSLQCYAATRFIFASNDQFLVANKLLEDPNFKYSKAFEIH